MFESVDHPIDGIVEEGKMEISDEVGMIHKDDDDDVTDTSSYKSAPSQPLSPETQESAGYYYFFIFITG